MVETKAILLERESIWSDERDIVLSLEDRKMIERGKKVSSVLVFEVLLEVFQFEVFGFKKSLL